METAAPTGAVPLLLVSFLLRVGDSSWFGLARISLPAELIGLPVILLGFPSIPEQI